MFYSKVPSGVIFLHTLETAVGDRLKFLQSLSLSEEIVTPTKYEYLYQGGSMDRTSHFLLRLACLSTSAFKEFFVKAETDLYIKRIKDFETKQYMLMLKCFVRHLNQDLSEESRVLLSPKLVKFFIVARDVCNDMLKDDCGIHSFDITHSDDCEAYRLKLPWIYCSDLIAGRLVELEEGIASVRCGQFRLLLISLFKLHLIHGLYNLIVTGAYDQAMNDERIYHLVTSLGKNFELQLAPKGSLTYTSVYQEVILFPPCMKNLANVVFNTHRLTHEARYEYSLFLKDAGMSLNDMLNYWKHEYSQPLVHDCKSACMHNWEDDSKRYTYSIRHLYGLEGRRVEKHVPSCLRLQSSSISCRREGGCPFTKFDTSSLIQCLDLKDKPLELEEILQLKENGHPLEACHVYLKAMQSSTSNTALLKFEQGEAKKNNSTFQFRDPLQFYLKAKKNSFAK